MAYNQGIVDALSLLAGSNAASLKFASWFGSGVNLGALTKYSSSLYTQDITGTDALTGFTFPTSLQAFMGNSVNTQVWLIPDPKTPDYDTGTLSSHIEAILQSSTAPQGPTGYRELYTPVHTRNSANGGNSKPQIPLMITRSGSGGLPPADLPEIYVSTWHFIPANLSTILDVAYGSNFYVLKDFKTGGYGGGNAFGDFRIYIGIIRASAGQPLYYKFAADNNANGNWTGIAGIPTVGNVTTYWQFPTVPGTSDGKAEDDLGYWVRVHLYIKMSQAINVRSGTTEAGATDPMYQQDTTTGYAYAAIENPSTGRWLTLGAKSGGRMRGNENLPWARMMAATCYCSATSVTDPIVFAKSTGLQIWDRPPIYLPTTVTKRSDAQTYWPLRGTVSLQSGGVVSTFTRATAAWEFNELGKMYKVPAGAVRMRGYRPVINQYSGNTDNMSGLSTARITLIDSATSDADGTTKAGTWRLDASAGEHYLRLQSSAFEGKYVNIAFKIKLTSYRYVALRIGSWFNFYDLQTQSWNGALQGSSRDAVVSGDWVLLEMTGGPVPSGSTVFSLLFTSAALGASWTPLGTEEVIVYQAMMSDVTGDTDKTFSDYVAGNTSYGAGANGVKYFATYKDGTPIPEANLLGARLNPNATTNNLLYCRDLTNAAWVKTNVTAALTQIGIDGQSNACSLVEFTTDGGTILQTVTAAAAAGCSGYYVKRHTGSGTVEFTRDNVNWTDITSQINASDFSLVEIENSSVTNPVIGFRGQNGDKIIVDAGINHLGTQISKTPIITTSAAVTVNADILTAPISGNFSDTAGTIIATVTRDDWTAGNGSAVGSATRGLYTSSANSGAQGLDGTNTVNGPSGTPSGTVKIGLRWSGTSLQVYSNGVFGNAGSYDGGFNLSSIALAAGTQCAIKDVAIWNTSLSDAEMIAAANNI